MAAWAMHAYHAAYVSMVVIGVFILVLTVVILAWRLIQHLRSRSAGSRGKSWPVCGSVFANGNEGLRMETKNLEAIERGIE